MAVLFLPLPPKNQVLINCPQHAPVHGFQQRIDPSAEEKGKREKEKEKERRNGEMKEGGKERREREREEEREGKRDKIEEEKERGKQGEVFLHLCLKHPTFAMWA